MSSLQFDQVQNLNIRQTNDTDTNIVATLDRDFNNSNLFQSTDGLSMAIHDFQSQYHLRRFLS